MKGTYLNYDAKLAQEREKDLDLIQTQADKNWEIMQMFFTIIVVVCLAVTFNYSPRLVHIISSI